MKDPERTNNPRWTSEDLKKWKKDGIRRMEGGGDGITSEFKDTED